MLRSEYLYLATPHYRVVAAYGGLYGYVQDAETGEQYAYLQGDDWDTLATELDNAPEYMQDAILFTYTPD
ncbi:MAG: hypothetical protein LC650_03830 [Actinobacteria bacterium]|nr:hypothetical protein [Actinomycetota bacterium]